MGHLDIAPSLSGTIADIYDATATFKALSSTSTDTESNKLLSELDMINRLIISGGGKLDKTQVREPHGGSKN